MHKSLALISILVWLGFSQTVVGQPTMDPTADRILKAHNAYMSSLNSLLVKADTTEEAVYNETHKLQFTGMLSIGLRPPAQFFATVHETDKNRRMYLNNGTFTVFDEDFNVYAQTTAPGTTSEVFSHLYSEFGMSSPGGELFTGHAYELLVENASRVIYVGVADINGTTCHHLAGVLETMDWQLWIKKDGNPELCKYAITDRDVPMAPQFSITFKEWTANAEFSDKQFAFHAPADAEAINFVKQAEE